MTNPYDPTYTPSYASVPAGQADNDHLRILAICHYVCAAIQALTGLMPAFYLAMGVFFLTHSFPTPASTYPSTTPFASPYSASTASPASDEKVVGWVFVAMGSIGVIFVETCAFLTLLSGLSIAKRAAMAHGGSVWVASDEADGTTFYAAIPADDLNSTLRPAARPYSAPASQRNLR